MKDEILEGVFLLSAKELMEAKRDMDMQFYTYGFNRLLSASLTDTIPVPTDTLIALLAADGSAASMMKQAWFYLENGDTTSALNKWNIINNEIMLNEAELSELIQQQAFMQWIVENQPIDTLDTGSLNNFSIYGSPVVSSSARGILIANNLLEYNEPYLEPDLTKSAEIRKPRTNSTQNSTESVRVFPNPGKDYVTIDYNLGDNHTSGSYEIADQTGKMVKKGNLSRTANQFVLDTHDLAPGNYYISLILSNRSVAISRFVIAK